MDSPMIIITIIFVITMVATITFTILFLYLIWKDGRQSNRFFDSYTEANRRRMDYKMQQEGRYNVKKK